MLLKSGLAEGRTLQSVKGLSSSEQDGLNFPSRMVDSISFTR